MGSTSFASLSAVVSAVSFAPVWGAMASAAGTSMKNIRLEYKILVGLLLEKEHRLPDVMDAKIHELNMRRIFGLVEKLVKDPSKIQKLEVVVDAKDSFGTKQHIVEDDSEPKFHEKVEVPQP